MATYAAQFEQYQKAIQIYEQVRVSVHHKLVRQLVPFVCLGFFVVVVTIMYMCSDWDLLHGQHPAEVRG